MPKTSIRQRAITVVNALTDAAISLGEMHCDDEEYMRGLDASKVDAVLAVCGRRSTSAALVRAVLKAQKDNHDAGQRNKDWRQACVVVAQEHTPAELLRGPLKVDAASEPCAARETARGCAGGDLLLSLNAKLDRGERLTMAERLQRQGLLFNHAGRTEGRRMNLPTEALACGRRQEGTASGCPEPTDGAAS